MIFLLGEKNPKTLNSQLRWQGREHHIEQNELVHAWLEEAE